LSGEVASFDLVIIGAGPAGIAAAVYSAREQLNFAVITGDIGGQTALSGAVENYIGYQFITGVDLTQKFEEHLRQFSIVLRENERVTHLEKQDHTFKIATAKGTYFARAVIIASGKKPKLLNVPGEAKFRNLGVTYCAVCDAPLFKDKDVAVIGGGNSALDATLQLMNIAKKIYLININPQPGGTALMRDKIASSTRVSVINNAHTEEILGEKFVTGVRVRAGKRHYEYAVGGVFVEIGSIPSSDFIDTVEKNPYGEIIVDLYNRTNVEGIFAAGDVTNIPEKQIIVAAGEGAKAALVAFKYIMGSQI
jgi:alkyl hydroperoxide reductase subunit F